ncbi:MAG: type II secretion system protein N [Kangiellaceae bacterium]|nr:type II secretion system protein N [Kangiellaceae bacterium]
MKKKIIILITLFVLLIIWLAPANLAEGLIASNKNIEASGLRGTLWSGSVEQIEMNGWHLEELDYELSFFSLLTGNMGGSAQLNGGDIIGALDFETDGEKNFSLAEASIEMEAYLFEKYLPFPGINLDGSVSTTDLFADIENKKAKRLDGLTTWQDASVTVANNVIKLGKFQINWSTDEDSQLIAGKVVKTANALSLDGRITLDKDGIFEFKGSISTRIPKSIYNAFLLFSDGKAKNDRLPIKYKKKL